MVNDNEFQWMTYAELAEARGIDKLSAVRITRNRRWPERRRFRPWSIG